MNWAQHPPNPLRRGVITMKYSFILNGEVLYTIIYVQFRIVKSFTQSCTEFFLTWIMLSEFHRGVALVEVVGRGLTALSKSLLAGDYYSAE